MKQKLSICGSGEAQNIQSVRDVHQQSALIQQKGIQKLKLKKGNPYYRKQKL